MIISHKLPESALGGIADILEATNNKWEMQTAYTYDGRSRLASIAQGGRSAVYTRHSLSDRLNTVNFGASYPQVIYSYDAQLRMTSKGLWTRTFNAKDEVTQIAPAAGSGVGNLNWYHSYDAAGQLSQGIFGVMGPSGPAGTTYNYSYDQIGNHQLSGVTYNTVNQPSNLTYDANGNMTAKDGKQYVYDGENRLIRIIENFYDAWEQGVEFHCDYAGRCYQRNDVFIDYTDSANNYNTPYEYIVYDGAKQIMTLDGDKNVTGKYVWQPESSGDADVILWDQGGVYSTDCNKNVVAYNIVPSEPGQPGATYYDYTPFGAPVGNASLSKRFMFSSEEWFPVRSTLNYDLLLYLYRAYSPALARFLTRDPINEQGGVNLYGFVGNNPVTNWDSKGMIRPKDLWDKFAEQQRLEWIAIFKNRFSKKIKNHAIENCIPAKLLAVIIANEMSDEDFLDNSIFDGLGGGGVGPAQISVGTAILEEVTSFQYNPSTLDLVLDAFQTNPTLTSYYLYRQRVWNELNSDEGAVKVAARLMRKYLSQLCAKSESGFGGGFLNSYLNNYGNCDISKICCADCASIVDTTPPDCLLKTMAAVWNSGITILSARDPLGDNNYPDALSNGTFAGEFVRYLNGIL